MKRSIQELRRVLLECEATDGCLYWASKDQSGYYHAQLLNDGGLAKAVEDGISDGRSIRVLRLTDQGHDLLDELRGRDPLRWAQDMLAAVDLDPDILFMVRGIMRQALVQILNQHDVSAQRSN